MRAKKDLKVVVKQKIWAHYKYHFANRIDLRETFEVFSRVEFNVL
jgi:hypothetical protein